MRQNLREDSSKSGSDQESASETDGDAFDIHQDNDDSRESCSEKTISMQRILAKLEIQNIVKLCLGLASQKYISENGIYKLDRDMSVEFAYRCLQMQSAAFKQTRVFREVVTPIVEQVPFS